MYTHLLLSLLVCCFNVSSLKAHEEISDYQKAFYALSSLTFYLQETVSKNSRQKDTNAPIDFTQDDIAHLWNTALGYAPSVNEVKKAQEVYYEGTKNSQDQQEFLEHCKKAYALVQDTWCTLNPYSLQEEPVIEKEREDGQFRYPNFDDNPYISSEMCKKMAPYLLPDKNKLKPVLDTLFSRSRVLYSIDTFAKAGFVTLFHQKHSLIRVAKHAALPGYLLKVYLDTDNLKDKIGWDRLTRRCQGAENVRRLIKDKKLSYYGVPDKWLYPPAFFKVITKNKQTVQPVILMVTDMNLVSLEESRKAWKTKVTHRHLDELYCILSHGLGSKTLPRNIPYTKNGKFACIDTEDPKKKIAFHRVKKYMSSSMQSYWDQLVKKGGVI